MHRWRQAQKKEQKKRATWRVKKLKIVVQMAMFWTPMCTQWYMSGPKTPSGCAARFDFLELDSEFGPKPKPVFKFPVAC